MRYADIPDSARPLEVAILLLYDPGADNKKEVRHILHLRSVRSVQKVVTKYKEIISKVSVPADALLHFSIEKQEYVSASSFAPPPHLVAAFRS